MVDKYGRMVEIVAEAAQCMRRLHVFKCCATRARSSYYVFKPVGRGNNNTESCRSIQLIYQNNEMNYRRIFG